MISVEDYLEDLPYGEVWGPLVPLDDVPPDIGGVPSSVVGPPPEGEPYYPAASYPEPPPLPESPGNGPS